MQLAGPEREPAIGGDDDSKKKSGRSVSVRISLLTEEERLTVQVEGRLVAEDAAVLQEQYGPSAAELTLDLSGLLSADETALAVLVAFQAAGTELRGASTYVGYVLDRLSSLDIPIPDLMAIRSS